MTKNDRPDVIFDKTGGREHAAGYSEAIQQEDHKHDYSHDRKAESDRMEGKEGQPNFIPGEARVGEKKSSG